MGYNTLKNRGKMRYLLLSALTCNLLLAFPVELDTIESDFTQTIVDDHNKSIIYEGKVWAKKPSNIHWRYLKPIEKDIYVKYTRVTMIEPDLEQVIMKSIGDDIDLIRIISHSKKVSDNHYIAKYNDRDYHIYLDKDVLKSLEYIDNFGNATVIEFKDMRQNEKFDDSNLEAVIPEDYDVIK
jgi:outer membrane lipoprotein carrier protein